MLKLIRIHCIPGFIKQYTRKHDNDITKCMFTFPWLTQGLDHECNRSKQMQGRSFITGFIVDLPSDREVDCYFVYSGMTFLV